MTIRRVYLLVVLLAIVLSKNVVFAQGDKEQSRAEDLFSGLTSKPAKVVNQFHQALATKDKTLALSLLDKNVLIYEGGKAERSAAEYAEHHLLSDMAFISSVTVQPIEHQVNIYGGVAVSTSRNKTTGSFKGKSINNNGMETIVLKLIADEWKITHIHWSN